MAKSWRHLFHRLVPSWLYSGDGARVLYSLMRVQDAFLERAYQGHNARYPRSLDVDSLRLLGQDRGITRGRNETAAHYADRLRAWRQTQAHRGGAWALLEQVQEYFREADGSAWECYTIDANGAKLSIAADGTRAAAYGQPWDWDGTVVGADNWARFWLVLKPPAGAVTATPDFGDPELDGDPELYGGALYDDAYALGHVGISSRDAKAIRDLMLGGGRIWAPGGVRPELVIVSLDGSDPDPDGTWQYFGVFDGVEDRIVPRTDRPAFRFWFLSRAVRLYSGEAAAGASALAANRDVTLPSGLAHTPSSATWPATVRMPDGSTIAGDPSKYPESVHRVDDGDIPI